MSINVQAHIIRKYIGGKLDKNKSEKEKEQKMLNTREKKLSPPGLLISVLLNAHDVNDGRYREPPVTHRC